jgi:hypothetical protein
MPSSLIALCLQIALSMGILIASPAQAGRACEEKNPKAEDVRQGLEAALRTREALEKSGAQVALVARVGQDLSRYGLKYSHIGFAWRGHPQGQWLVMHELNQCGTAQSALFAEGLGNFFLDDVFTYEALVLVPDKKLQDGLHAIFSANAARRLHEPHYNMLAYPFSVKYQNSNQWVLETLVQAAQPQRPLTRAEAQAWLQAQAYEPSVLKLGPVTRLGARTRANIQFDDHPNAKRFSDHIEVVSVDSLMRFMERRQWVTQKLELRP